MKHQLMAECKIWRKPLVEHQIDKHSSDRNVKPDRDCPARNPFVAIPPAAKNLNERQNHQRQCYKGKQNMRSQYREVNGGDPSGISRRFFADVHVISDVANQETGRRNHCRDHARHMAAPCAMPDEVPAHGDKNRADQIQGSVDRWKIGD